MPRLQGVDIPSNKPTHISLRYIRGIGPTLSLRLCETTGIDPQRRASELTDDELARIALLLAADGLSAATKSTITAAVTAIKADTDVGKLSRVQASVLLVMASPEYLIQK